MTGTGYRLVAMVAGVSLLALSGCRVDEHKNGDNENVKISTPFGGMSVKTDDSTVQAGVGLSAYPGATVVKDHDFDDNGKHHGEGAADFNMSFGSFHLGVKALSYQTPDSPDKVLAFYRKDMARYGKVLFCRDNHAVGEPTVTQDGLTCDHDSKNNIHVNNDMTSGDQGELRAGSKLHQHIVSVESKGSGTKFGLVMLDLPGHVGDDDDDSHQ